MKIGIFGGTFDPPHIGHRILAAEAMAQLNLDHVLWVLTNYPPHKKEQIITSIEHRVEMVKLAIGGNNRFWLSRIDIDREPPHYAVDTVRLLKEQAPNDEYYYLMGYDSLNDLPKWHSPQEFVHLCDGIVVMARHGQKADLGKLQNSIPGISRKSHFLNTPVIDISSSDIRSRVASGVQFRYFVPEKIYKYIQEYQLYQS